jgi:hypothetical protein
MTRLIRLAACEPAVIIPALMRRRRARREPAVFVTALFGVG